MIVDMKAPFSSRAAVSTLQPFFNVSFRRHWANVTICRPHQCIMKTNLRRGFPHRLCATVVSANTVRQHKEKKISTVSRIQIKHQTQIPIPKADILDICKEMCQEDWEAVQSVLAGIECIQRFECQLEGERALNAFEKANVLEHVTGSPDIEEIDAEMESSLEERSLKGKNRFPGLLHGVLPFCSKPKESVADLKAELKEREKTAQYHQINKSAREADRKFVFCLKRLLALAHYDAFDVRDVALSRSLNSDYLSQIFIKADASRMDGGLINGETSEDLPAEVRPLLIYKRGYGSKTEFRRLFLPMMDYLQLLIVKSAFNTFKEGIIRVWTAISNLIKHILAKLGIAEEPDAFPPDQLRSLYVAEGLMSEHLRIDKKSWKRMKRVGKDVIVSMNEWGISPKVMALGGGTLVTLADWGYIPRLDALPIETFDSVWPVKDGAAPVYLSRIALPNTMSHVLQDGPSGLLKKVMLKEPTFEHLIIVYRHQKKESPIDRLKKRVGKRRPPKIAERKQIQIRIYSEIPIPIWKAVVPAKLVQFRPLDGLRLDLITIVGLLSLAAHARFTSILFDIVTITTLVVYGIRVIMGYKKMYDRYDNFLNDLLRRRTIAGQEGALAYLANSAYLQQFKQCALAYCLLVSSKSALRKDEISAQLNKRLRDLEEKISFDVDEALNQLRRLKLVRISFLAGYGETFIADKPSKALKSIKLHWNTILEQSIDKSVDQEKEQKRSNGRDSRNPIGTDIFN